MTDIPKVKDFMTQKIVAIRDDWDLNQTIHILIDQNISSAPVIKEENGKSAFLGFVTEGDCLKALANQSFYEDNKEDLKVSGLMNTGQVVVDPEMDLFKLEDLFLQNDSKIFPVVEEGKLLGVVARRDALKAGLDYLTKRGKEVSHKFEKPLNLDNFTDLQLHFEHKK